MVQTLQQDKITREERVKLITDAESLHSFNSMLNRTRRKDIQDFCIRRPYTLAVEFTPEQQALHDELLRFEQNALLQLHGDARSIPFMMSTIKRQASSCIFGLAPHIRDLIKRRFVQIEDDPDNEMPGFEFAGESAGALESLAQNLLRMADNLPTEDPKFDQMMTAIMEKQKQDNNKIILFSTFRFTLRYLKEKLKAAGLRVEQVDGGVKDSMRQDYRARFELPKEDPDAIDILLFTEVGSEGLDYQFCDMMINYDLPWNPMRIEQRIGRIDRRGQQSEAVSIYNVITNGTVDADIYYRCLMRIGIFESSIGECEEILGDIATQIDQIAVDSSLTEEERRIKLEQMADNEVRKIQEMDRLEEEEKEFFGFDLSEYTTTQEIHNAENPWLNQKGLQIMIEQYLNARLGQGTYILGEGDVKQLRLSANARLALREDFRKLPAGRNAVRQTWDIYLKGKAPLHTITFDSDAAEKNRDAFFITAMHPLARQAAEYYESNEKRRDYKYIVSAANTAKPMIAISVSDLDKNENLINTPYATYDLRKGIAGEQPHNPEDLITKITACSPGEEGKKIWMDALNLFFCKDQKLIDYVQETVGMAAIGKVYQEHMIIAYGGGANGKSTFWNTIFRVLGNYAGKLSAEALTMNCKRNVKPEMAELKGKRLIISSEMEEGMRLNTAVVKQLCSTDEIQAEKKYKDPFSFVPSHTLVLYTNHLPKVGANDDGIWRRLVVIPFNAKITGKSDIKNYADYLFEHAGPAIMSWIIEGAKRAIDKNFHTTLPDVVEAAIQAYREDNDWLGQFLEECCEIDPSYKEKSGELYQAYRAHCMQNGEYIRSTTDFYSSMDKAGYNRIRKNTGVQVVGLKLKEGQDFLE